MAPATNAIPARDDPRGEVILLVLAHEAPRCLHALAMLCVAPWFRIVVHVDRKVDLDRYRGDRCWPATVTFLDERWDIFWGGFNMIRATESLARHALSHSDGRVFALVSDDSLPLLPPDTVYAELQARMDRIDLGLTRRNPPFLRRYTEFFFLDSHATSARPVPVETRHVTETAVDAVFRLNALRLRGKSPVSEIWGGSQWWSFSRASLQAILQEAAGNIWQRESFEFSAVPDELFFHTIHANQRGLTERSFTGPMLTDMSRHPSPFAFRRYAELPSLPPHKLFVRKIVDEAASGFVSELQDVWARG